VRSRSAELAVRVFHEICRRGPFGSVAAAHVGATPRHLYRLVATQGLALTGLGVVVALPVVGLGFSWLEHLQPSFPDVAAGAGIATLFVVTVVGGIATFIPAQRAARTSISETLRNE
jgi:ABC-type antimicrobial peptide transport system permease subunit